MAIKYLLQSCIKYISIGHEIYKILHFKAFQYIPKYCDIFQKIPKYTKILWNIPKDSKILWHIPKDSKILWHIPKDSKIHQNWKKLTVCRLQLFHFLEGHEVETKYGLPLLLKRNSNANVLSRLDPYIFEDQRSLLLIQVGVKKKKSFLDLLETFPKITKMLINMAYLWGK
jgi:hypothetical protein